MDSSDLSTLIGRLEREADAHPQLYRGKVAVAAALGYLAPGLVALEILYCFYAIVHALVTGRTPPFLAAIGVLAGFAAALFTFRALRVQGPQPEGMPLTAEEAPDLFRLLDVIGRRIVPAPFATVKVNGEFKLGIRQIPRWGIFGGYANHLHVGTQLLLALSAAASSGSSQRGSIASGKPGHCCRRSSPHQPTRGSACSPCTTPGTRHGSVRTASRSRAITNTSPITSLRSSPPQRRWLAR